MEHTNVILSILICSLYERAFTLNKLLDTLNKQIKNYNNVEILIEKDNREITTGEKRNLLLEKANGEYICFIDDDDMVADDYISSIMTALEEKPDCVGIQGLLMCSKGSFLFEHSIQYQGWYTTGTKDNPHFIRTPNHLNPVRKLISQRMGFPLKNVGEDGEYSMRIRQYLKTEIFIDHPIYFYFTEAV